MDTTDAELVSRVRAGDAGAFDVLVHRHYADCLRYAYRMLGERADAEDAVQEAFVRAYRALPRYDERDRFRAWLLRILRNRCRSIEARRSRRAAGLRLYRATSGARTADPPSSLVAEDVQRALSGLAPRLREAFLLKHVEELTYEEMASVTGASVSALKMRVKRACDALERALREVSER